GATTGVLGLTLAGCIVLYDAVHKRVAFGPVLMGLCRFILYLVAASAAVNGLNPRATSCGFALFACIVGVAYVGRPENVAGPLRYWPFLLLAMPIVVALIFNGGYKIEHVLLASAIFLVWTVKSLRYALWSGEPNFGRTVSGLLAGIVWVDLVAVGNV